jgi:hypothetical protein
MLVANSSHNSSVQSVNTSYVPWTQPNIDTIANSVEKLQKVSVSRQIVLSSLKKVVEFTNKQYKFDEAGSKLLAGRRVRVEVSAIGVNGAPILYDEETKKPIAIFKPNDSAGSVVKYADLIAFKLDDGFAKVPRAFKLEALDEKAPRREQFLSGNFVEWIPNHENATMQERLHINNEERQAISILDMRLGNCDRTAYNLLIDKKGHLIPIDHDHTFTYFERRNLCVEDAPLFQAGRDYITHLDINRDVATLREFEVPENAIANFVIRTVFLKLGAEESEISIGVMEQIIESLRLPAGGITSFINDWIYHYSLREILAKQAEPYDETALKNAFRESFKEARANAESWLTTTFIFNALIKGTLC